MRPETTRIKPCVLVICDGLGSAPAGLQGNAVLMAETPRFMDLWSRFPHTELFAHGQHVGLPKHQPGNSEAGHMNLGAGRIVKQDAVIVSESIEDGTFYKNTAFLEALKHAKKYGTTVHLMGMLADGKSAHASHDHLYGLIELCRRQGIGRVRLQLFTDGRDGPRFGSTELLHELEGRLRPHERIATLMGRFYAMDRNRNWKRIEMAYRAIVGGEGLAAPDAEAALTSAYNRGETDEFVLPTVIVEDERPVGMVRDNDVVIFFNLRSDRARQLTKTFVLPEFERSVPDAFRRRRVPSNIRFVAMTDFGPDLPNVLTAYPGRDLRNALPEVLKRLRQIYIAESEKFSHITFFFNGGYPGTPNGEERVRIESLPIPRVDMAPQMRTPEIASEIAKRLKAGRHHFIAANFANADMVGHTGNLDATVEAVEVIDAAIGKIWDQIEKTGGTLIVTADHGNAEEMIEAATGAIETEHSVNPVPFLIASKELAGFRELPHGTLADVAPTILDVMGLHQPEEMTGRSLLSD